MMLITVGTNIHRQHLHLIITIIIIIMTAWHFPSSQGGTSGEHARLSAALEMKEHELRLMDERASQSLHTMRATQVRRGGLKPFLRAGGGR
jgi:hypothetical protein